MYDEIGAAAAELRATVAAIFARVLRQDAVGDDDDFFDLGGDSIRAVTLMLEIAQATGHDLPITTIYDAPTVAAMADLLAGSGSRSRRSCLVLLRPGIAPPLFVVHGWGGTVMELRGLARRLDTAHAVYGIEAPGLDGVAAPYDRVEDMARAYLSEIRRAQPAGPYLLAGFSFGGLVALELARRLADDGEKVALLAFLDTFPHTRYWPLRCRFMAWRRMTGSLLSFAVLTRVMRHYGAEMRALSFREIGPFVLNRLEGVVRAPLDILRFATLVHRFSGTGPQDNDQQDNDPTVPAGFALPAAVRQVKRAASVAYGRYRPRFHEGEIVFIKATADKRLSFDARVLWEKRVRALTVHTVPGSHVDLVRGGAAHLGAVLSMCVEDAMARQERGRATAPLI